MTVSYRTVFASGEASTADAAYALADRSLWAQIAERYPRGKLARVEHSTAARTAVQKGLNVKTFETERVEVSNIVVTLMATIQIHEEETTNDE
ncbi:hypothetical protein RS84_00026 [Microbacterium hydrocarbonoxydans]|uniref:Uncharacterized protein n=1 Tax=Microbacterium hydrocarbonoxydans TaxID=273678 RepID=A0A0M2HS17_9MICO|nr:hypothetical protein [Microbacterium hydrocarbonoxydans]KJL49552.1 hypothetical protein RS84_00026 [Microbacterium hydrocarbonoxydans]